MWDAFKRMVGSQKFQTALVGVIIAVGLRLGLKVDQTLASEVVGLFAVAVGAQGIADHGKSAAQINAAAAKAEPSGTVTP